MSQASAEMGLTGPTLTASGSIKAFLYAFLRPCIIAEIYIERGHTVPESDLFHHILTKEGSAEGRAGAVAALGATLPLPVWYLCVSRMFLPPHPLCRCLGSWAVAQLSGGRQERPCTQPLFFMSVVF